MTEIVIKPKQIWKLIDFAEIWNFRELMYIFAWRDIKVRYKQTILGIIWVVFQPLVTMIIFTFFFGKMAKIPSGELPYSLFVLCGLVFWTFFSGSLSHAADSLVVNESIIKKVYFPKVVLPLSSVITGSADFFINFILLLIFAMFLGITVRPVGLIIFPLVFFLTSITSIGLGLILASFNVKYRDVRYILPFFIQILLFLTPVIYPLSIVSPANRIIMALNPMTSVVEAVRFAFSPTYMLKSELILISLISSVFIFILGLWYFRKTEDFFADIV